MVPSPARETTQATAEFHELDCGVPRTMASPDKSIEVQSDTLFEANVSLR